MTDRIAPSPPTGLADAPPQQPAALSTQQRLGLALAVIAMAQLMVVLDASIVITALPHIQRALHFSSTGLSWVVTANAITFGGLMLVGGRAGDRLGRKELFVVGLLVFSAASLAGGLAQSPAMMLVCRAIQGAGGAMIAPTALALIITTFPEGQPRNGPWASMPPWPAAGRRSD
jgi:MFS family permease